MTFLALAAFLLLGAFFLLLLTYSLQRLHKRDSKRLLKVLGNKFIYRPLILKFFPQEEYEALLFSTIFTSYLTLGLVILLAFLEVNLEGLPAAWSTTLFLFVFGGSFYFLGWDYLPRFLASRYPAKMLPFASFFSSPFLCISFPLSFILMKCSQKLLKTVHFNYLHETAGDVKHEILEILHAANISPGLSPHERKLIESVFSFQHRLVKEIMIPRIDLFSLSTTTTIAEAARHLKEQGYSRIPVYKDTIDTIAGVLMYKDITLKYMEYVASGNDPKILEAPIETILKKVMYAPETKKVSNLLQEFRKKQTHIAIVVDEYGGTEGIVTIEDILEEIVGEIEDEYDEDQDLFIKVQEGVWIVDARMSILDLEEQLGVAIPQKGDYETLGGYLFQRAGMIPSKGFSIQLDEVELEVLKSNDRKIEKVKIKKIFPKDHE